MKNIKHILTVVLACSILAGIGILQIVLPTRSFSEIENRYLSQAPSFSWQRFVDGDYAEDMETYLADQIPFRDGFVALKTRYEYLLGKREFHDVYLCDDTLIAEVIESDQGTENLEYVARFQQESDIPVYFGLIPTAAEVWRDKLPADAPSFDQIGYIQSSTAYTANPVDILAQLTAHQDEPIYYRTDHHWTSLGAYYGYCAFLEALQCTPSVLITEPDTVTTEFNGTLYSKSGVHWLEPDSIETYVHDPEITVSVNNGSSVETHGLYVPEKLNGKDKYSYFLGGNSPLVIIQNPNLPDGEKLLVVRDSYSDAMAPFLSQEFSEVHLIDLRYYRSSVKRYAQENGIDRIYICYSADNFQSDLNLANLCLLQ